VGSAEMDAKDELQTRMPTAANEAKVTGGM
jgi:hypothetical protein